MLQYSRPVTKFTEEFDFMAMNEKFKKDEVWGHLGKSNKSGPNDKERDGYMSDEDDFLDDDHDAEKPKIEAKVKSTSNFLFLLRLYWALN